MQKRIFATITLSTLFFILGFAVPAFIYANESISIDSPSSLEKISLSEPVFKGISAYPNSDMTLFVDDKKIRNSMTDMDGNWEIYLPEAENLENGIHIARVEVRDLVKDVTKSSTTVEFEVEHPEEVAQAKGFFDRHPYIGSVWSFLKALFEFYF